MRQLLLSLLCALSLPAWAFNISGTAVDEAGEPMAQASVQLMKPDSSVVKTALADINGQFKLNNLKRGKYIVQLSYVGYKPLYKNVTGNTDDINLGRLSLSSNALMLGEVTATGVRTPIKVMQDTVEYNTGAYQTQPNAVVEDLLKKLPGVEVGTDGAITANGKKVTKILVDGKEFFGEDPTVASRNLPTNMVDKIQVVDRKSDLARMTGVDDGEEETVINLTVKKGMNNGWFGNAEAGLGTDTRYKGSFNINKFWNGNQLTLLGGINNINQPGFNDGMSGRFMRFGGDNGITTSRALGLNFNIGKEEIIRFGGNVMYSNTDRNSWSQSSRTNLFANDSTSYYDSEKTARDQGHSFNADLRVEWKPDAANSFDFRPSFRWSRNTSTSVESSLTRSGLLKNVAQSLNDQSSIGDSYDVSGRLIYNHNFLSHPGRSFSISGDYSLQDTRERPNTYSWNRFFLLDSLDVYDQYADNHTWTNRVSARATWTEPLNFIGNGHFATMQYRFQYRWNNADKMTYRHPVTNLGDSLLWSNPYAAFISDDAIFNPELSNQFRNDYMAQNISVGYKYVSKTTNLEAGVGLTPQWSQSINLLDDAKSIAPRTVLNFAPYLRYRLKMGKSSSANIDYNGRSSQPSMAQLQPVADVSNPLRIVVGNPNLLPSFNHNLRLRYSDFNAEAQRSIMLMMNGGLEQNSIVQETTYDPNTGGQTSTYRNTNGIWNLMGMNMISLPINHSRTLMFNNHIMGRYASSVSYNGGQRNTGGSLNLREAPGLTWRPGTFDFSLRPYYGLQLSHYSLTNSQNKRVHQYGGNFSASYEAPFGLTLSSDLDYSQTKGYGQGYDVAQWMWNATASYSFLRDRSLTLSLTARDILNDRKNVSRSTGSNFIQDSKFTTLTRYCMLSLSYRFNTFGKGNEPASRNTFDDHGGRRGPMGPPPGHPRF